MNSKSEYDTPKNAEEAVELLSEAIKELKSAYAIAQKALKKAETDIGRGRDMYEEKLRLEETIDSAKPQIADAKKALKKAETLSLNELGTVIGETNELAEDTRSTVEDTGVLR